MKTNPLISVILPVYNAGKFLNESIDSILNQTVEDFEFIIIDDASIDNSIEIIQSYQDNRIRFFRNKQNLGISKTLNFGISKAKGKFIARMDADDIALRYRFQEQLQFMNNNLDIDICGSYVQHFGDSNETWEPPLDHESIRVSSIFFSPMVHPTIFARYQYYQKHIYDSGFDYAEDYHLWISSFDSANFANIPQVLLKYRFHARQTSTALRTQQKEVGKRIRTILLDKVGCEYNDKELELYMKIVNMSDDSDIASKQNCLMKLLQANQKSAYYDNVIFENFLSSYLWDTYNQSTSKSWKILKMTYKSPLIKPSSISLLKHIKFIIKCVIKYNRRDS